MELNVTSQVDVDSVMCPGAMTHHGPPGKKKPKEASEKKRRVKIEGESMQGADDESLGRETGDMAG